MKHVGWIIAAVLVAACQSDPYMARKGGYTPGTYSSAYKSTAHASQADHRPQM